MKEVGFSVPVLFELYHSALYEENNPDWAEFASRVGRPKAKLEVLKVQHWIVSEWMQVNHIPSPPSRLAREPVHWVIVARLTTPSMMHDRISTTRETRRRDFSSPLQPLRDSRSALASTSGCVNFSLPSPPLPSPLRLCSCTPPNRPALPRRARTRGGCPNPLPTFRRSWCG
jgi:hypothetical protein